MLTTADGVAQCRPSTFSGGPPGPAGDRPHGTRLRPGAARSSSTPTWVRVVNAGPCTGRLGGENPVAVGSAVCAGRWMGHSDATPTQASPGPGVGVPSPRPWPRAAYPPWCWSGVQKPRCHTSRWSADALGLVDGGGVGPSGQLLAWSLGSNDGVPQRQRDSSRGNGCGSVGARRSRARSCSSRIGGRPLLLRCDTTGGFSFAAGGWWCGAPGPRGQRRTRPGAPRAGRGHGHPYPAIPWARGPPDHAMAPGGSSGVPLFVEPLGGFGEVVGLVGGMPDLAERHSEAVGGGGEHLFHSRVSGDDADPMLAAA